MEDEAKTDLSREYVLEQFKDAVQLMENLFAKECTDEDDLGSIFGTVQEALWVFEGWVEKRKGFGSREPEYDEEAEKEVGLEVGYGTSPDDPYLTPHQRRVLSDMRQRAMLLPVPVGGKRTVKDVWDTEEKPVIKELDKWEAALLKLRDAQDYLWELRQEQYGDDDENEATDALATVEGGLVDLGWWIDKEKGRD